MGIKVYVVVGHHDESDAYWVEKVFISRFSANKWMKEVHISEAEWYEVIEKEIE